MKKKTLIDFDGWYARVSADVKHNNHLLYFPFDLGAVVLTSFDDERNFIIDTVSTDYQLKDTNIIFESKLDIDTDTFPKDEDEYNYELLIEDLVDCEATFYCRVDEDVDELASYQLDRAYFYITFYFRDGTEIQKTLKLEE